MQDQLAAEETRRTSLEQRGLAVITSSGVVATLGFGSHHRVYAVITMGPLRTNRHGR
jgi:hypothetical protein